MSWLDSLFGPAGLMPHGVCFLMRSDLIALHVVADALIAFAYFSIPVTLVHFVRQRKDVPFKHVLALFAAFILLCGMTHIFGIWTIWRPVYYLEAVVKLVTAVVSVLTAVVLIPLVPKLLSMRSNAELEAINLRLEKEIDRRATAERQLRDTIQQLTQSNAELERFAYIASHDLQAPLRTIGSFSSLLNKRYADSLDDDGQEYLRYIQDGVTDMRALINDLLELSRVNSTEAEIVEVPMEEVVGRVTDQLRADIEANAATIHVDALPAVQADARGMQQIFQNLIANAMKFQPAGQAPVVRIRAERRPTGWQFSVQDNGIGMAPEDCEKIFGVFKRLHTTAEYPGTGIGLSLVRKLVEKRGGRIRVDSRPGEGSTFVFDVPDRLPASPEELLPALERGEPLTT
ncbi:MAG: ATP-binding protein [Abyssibacter sp.]|uniref:sensor histidine kinase n=1 Tax=Abyssibacter sp. TaxID=2320200 RepID=UPI003219BA79